MLIDRIPGFAVCARCGGRQRLSACTTCGLLVCAGCRSPDGCAVCVAERRLRKERARQRARLRQLGRRVGVVASVAAAGITAAGAVLLAEGPPPPGTAEDAFVARAEVRFLADAVLRYQDAHQARCPESLATLLGEGLEGAPVDPWGEPLVYGCLESPRAFLVGSKGPDRQLGTIDDVLFTTP